MATLARLGGSLGCGVRDRHFMVSLGTSRDRARAHAGEPWCLRGGVAVLAIALSVLATGGVWAYVNPRVVPTPPEFEVPAPAVLNAELAMLSYRIAALDCSIARISIKRDVMGLPECATLPEMPRRRRNKSEARLRDEARQARCQQLMVDLELATTCGRPDVAAYATQLSVAQPADRSSEPLNDKDNPGRLP
jgi:hypothetical protein